MPNSPTNVESEPEIKTQKRNCDFCGESVALVYCRADSAKLCLSCDREVHSTNPLFTKHTRFQLCDNCDSAPASIFCCTDQSVFCQNCDYEIHRQLGSSSNHDRRPLEGFTGCPSVAELAGVIGFENFDAKCLSLIEEENHNNNENNDNNKGFNGDSFDELFGENDGLFSDLFAWDVPTMVNLDDLIVSTDRTHNFQAMVVPPLPKDRNLSCGQHKHEMLRQLHEIGKSDTGMQQDVNPLASNYLLADENDKDSGAQHMIRAYEHNEPAFGLNEASPYTWCNDTGDAINDTFLSSAVPGSLIEECGLNSDTHSGICSSENVATNGSDLQYPVSSESPRVPLKISTRELCSADRGSAISRYKEKKRTRRFQKHIRYESRKVQAENRTRIKGRFAKVNNRTNQA